MEFLLGFTAGMVFLAVAFHLMTRYVERELMRELEKNYQDALINNTVVAMVEVVDNRYFCYNKHTNQFICYGNSLAELVQRFGERFPNLKLILESDDTAVIDQLVKDHQQLKEST